jgi:hypothetical protein
LCTGDWGGTEAEKDEGKGEGREGGRDGEIGWRSVVGALRKIKRASSYDDQESLDRTSYFEGKKLYISQGIWDPCGLCPLNNTALLAAVLFSAALEFLSPPLRSLEALSHRTEFLF